MILFEVSPFGPAAICNSFDLSCCCVALQVQSDMASNLTFYHGSKHDLDNSTMCLLPSSFWSQHYPNVAMQMLRVLKYSNRNFELKNNVRSNDVSICDSDASPLKRRKVTAEDGATTVAMSTRL